MDMRLRLYFDTVWTASQSLYLQSMSKKQAIDVNFYNEVVVDIDHVINQTRHQIELVQEHRTRLIADVVTGKLDVREAAAALPEVNALASKDDLSDPSGQE